MRPLYNCSSLKLLYLKEMGATSKHSPVYNWYTRSPTSPSGQHLDPGGDHSPVYNLYTRSPTSPSGFTQMAHQSDTLVSCQLFICLELVLLVANVLRPLDLGQYMLAAAPAVLMNKSAWNVQHTQLPCSFWHGAFVALCKEESVLRTKDCRTLKNSAYSLFLILFLSSSTSVPDSFLLVFGRIWSNWWQILADWRL